MNILCHWILYSDGGVGVSVKSFSKSSLQIWNKSRGLGSGMAALERIAGSGEGKNSGESKVWLDAYTRTPILLTGRTSKAVTKTQRKAVLLKLNLAHIRACFLAPASPPCTLWCSHPILHPCLFFFFCFSYFDKYPKRKLDAQPQFSAISFFVLCIPFFYLLSFPVSRLWLPDQAADGSGWRSLSACLGGGSWPHSHMRCLRSLHLCSAWQWGKKRAKTMWNE